MQIKKTIKNFKLITSAINGNKLSAYESVTTNDEIIFIESAKDFAKNGTHVNDKRIKVINLLENNFLYLISFSNVKNNPCKNPHNRKFNVAPCQRDVKKCNPKISIVF